MLAWKAQQLSPQGRESHQSWLSIRNLNNKRGDPRNSGSDGNLVGKRHLTVSYLMLVFHPWTHLPSSLPSPRLSPFFWVPHPSRGLAISRGCPGETSLSSDKGHVQVSRPLSFTWSAQLLSIAPEGQRLPKFLWPSLMSAFLHTRGWRGLMLHGCQPS